MGPPDVPVERKRPSLAKDAARAQVHAEEARTRRVGWDARAQALEGCLELWMNQKMRALIDEQLAPWSGEGRPPARARM